MTFPAEQMAPAARITDPGRMVAPAVLRPDDAASNDPGLAGGKAGRLASLARWAPVPPWIVLTTEACARVLSPLAGRLEQALAEVDPSRRESVRTASLRIGEWVREAGLDVRDAEELIAAAGPLFAARATVAVRSSAAAEDGAEHSFAGQLDSFLNVRREQLVPRVLDCIASLFSERAILYRALRGLPRTGARTAVIVQRLVPARAAGVLFTADPRTGRRDEVVISAGLGLGEGVVADRVETDTFFVGPGGQVRPELVRKRARVALDEQRGSGTALVPVLDEEADRPVLSEEQARRLAELGRRGEREEGAPQDMEWAIDPGGKLWLLQIRPITALPPAAPAPGGREERETVFDGSNIVESYPGVSSPLTFSVARQGYAAIFRGAARLFGVPAAVVKRSAALFESLIGSVQGRIYYQILSWYRLYQLVPGFDAALPAWEKALGLEPRHRRLPPPRRGLDRLSGWLLRVRVLVVMGVRLLRLESDVKRFARGFAAQRRDFAAADLESLGAHQLLELCEQMMDRFCGPYAISQVNDFFLQQLYEAVRRLIGRLGLGEPDALRNGLFCGVQGVESVAPVRSALGLAERIRGDQALRELFEGPSPDTAVWRRLREEPRFLAFLREAEAHLREYGDRTLHELKLETPTLSDRPEELVALLRSLLRSGRRMEEMEAHEREVRLAAEAQVRAGLAGRPLWRAAFAWVLRRARRGVAIRESLRLARTRAFGIAKRIYRQLGRLFFQAGLLRAPEDVFFLTAEEISGAVRGHGATGELAALVELRRAEHRRFARSALPGRFSTFGIVLARGGGETPAGPAPLRDEGAALRGTGCGQGRARAPALIALEPETSLDARGRILVAPMTDPGWVFLMVTSSGIISERGSLLSHTAIIGRELGIPTVVGVKDATSLLRDGEPIEIDAAAGTVTRVGPAGPGGAS